MSVFSQTVASLHEMYLSNKQDAVCLVDVMCFTCTDTDRVETNLHGPNVFNYAV